MAFFHTEYYEQIKDFLHPHVNSFIDHYRNGNLIELPVCHGWITELGSTLTMPEDVSVYVQPKSIIGETQTINTKKKKSFGQDI